MFTIQIQGLGMQGLHLLAVDLYKVICTFFLVLQATFATIKQEMVIPFEVTLDFF